MLRFLKWSGIVLSLILIGGALYFTYMLKQTKSHSPHGKVEYKTGGYDIEVEYYRPFKKEREIFGGLVPYGEVWRTGANEATVFRTATDLKIGGETLPAGEYTLWTIPDRRYWEVIFNSGSYSWGTDWDGNPARDPEKDVLVYTAKSYITVHVREQFTILLESEPPIMILTWDNIHVEVPMQ